MQKQDINKVKNKKNPLFKGLPSRLKDVKNFDEIEASLQGLIKADHQHKTVTSYVKCPDCQKRFHDRRAKMKEIGFKNIQQYVEWKKIMVIIKNKKSFIIA